MNRIIVLFWVVLLFASMAPAFGAEPAANAQGTSATFPLGYPWSSWGELTETPDAHQEKGLKIDGYAEQGIDWVKLGKTGFVLNSFIGIKATASTHGQDYWNNQVGPWAGLSLKHTLSLGENNWGEVALGTRWEYRKYLSSQAPQKNDSRALVFLDWSLGGDWKKQ